MTRATTLQAMNRDELTHACQWHSKAADLIAKTKGTLSEWDMDAHLDFDETLEFQLLAAELGKLINICHENIDRYDAEKIRRITERYRRAGFDMGDAA